MKVCLIGYEGSKHILPASSYLIGKYLPEEFDIQFLNFGDYNQEDLHRGTYVKLEDEDDGVQSWAKYLVKYFESIEDKYVIFALDDMFLCREINMNSYNNLFNKFQNDEDISCAKLGISPSYRPHEYQMVDENIFVLNANAGYSATTQYTIWDKKVLIDILNDSTDPWHFENHGSTYFNQSGYKVIGTTDIVLPYNESTALSKKQPGKISVLGNTKEDIEYMIKNDMLDENCLCMGQPIGEVKSYTEFKDNPYQSLEQLGDAEQISYYTLILDSCLQPPSNHINTIKETSI
jgi:hypothetical protein